MTAPKKTVHKKPVKKANPPRQTHTKITAEIEPLLETAVLKYGEYRPAYESLDITKSNFYKYINQHGDFKDSLSRARARHAMVHVEEKGAGNTSEYEVLAMEGLLQLLKGGEIERYTMNRERAMNEDTGKPTEWVNETEKRWNEYIKPDLGTITKVLGSGNIRQITMRILGKQAQLDPNLSLAAQILGISEDEVKAEIGAGNILYEDKLDLALTRIMQAQVAAEHKAGLITSEKFREDMQALSGKFQSARHNIELRYGKLLMGRSFFELFSWLFTKHKELLYILNEVVNNEDIDRSDILERAVQRFDEENQNDKLLSVISSSDRNG